MEIFFLDSWNLVRFLVLIVLQILAVRLATARCWSNNYLVCNPCMLCVRAYKVVKLVAQKPKIRWSAQENPTHNNFGSKTGGFLANYIFFYFWEHFKIVVYYYFLLLVWIQINIINSFALIFITFSFGSQSDLGYPPFLSYSL